jgi:uncharacterized protein YrzB (UPF0473 family)
MEGNKNSIITLTDESGREVDFDLVCTFDYENKRYAALFPIEKVEGVEDDEVMLLEVKGDGQETVFDPIENEVLLDEVFNEFMEIFDDMVERDDTAES